MLERVDAALEVEQSRQQQHKTQAPILRLPNEVLCYIFAHLDNCSSVCAGLACHELWDVHGEFAWPPESLLQRSESIFLHQLLAEWMTESWRFCYWRAKFIRVKKELGFMGGSDRKIVRSVLFHLDVLGVGHP